VLRALRAVGNAFRKVRVRVGVHDEMGVTPMSRRGDFPVKVGKQNSREIAKQRLDFRPSSRRGIVRARAHDDLFSGLFGFSDVFDAMQQLRKRVVAGRSPDDPNV
jgi:hypothetical protein